MKKLNPAEGTYFCTIQFKTAKNQKESGRKGGKNSTNTMLLESKEDLQDLDYRPNFSLAVKISITPISTISI